MLAWVRKDDRKMLGKSSIALSVLAKRKNNEYTQALSHHRSIVFNLLAKSKHQNLLKPRCSINLPLLCASHDIFEHSSTWDILLPCQPETQPSAQCQVCNEIHKRSFSPIMSLMHHWTMLSNTQLTQLYQPVRFATYMLLIYESFLVNTFSTKLVCLPVLDLTGSYQSATFTKRWYWPKSAAWCICICKTKPILWLEEISVFGSDFCSPLSTFSD